MASLPAFITECFPIPNTRNLFYHPLQHRSQVFLRTSPMTDRTTEPARKEIQLNSTGVRCALLSHDALQHACTSHTACFIMPNHPVQHQDKRSSSLSCPNMILSNKVLKLSLHVVEKNLHKSGHTVFMN
jgi:hypothetical protein